MKHLYWTSRMHKFMFGTEYYETGSNKKVVFGGFNYILKIYKYVINRKRIRTLRCDIV